MSQKRTVILSLMILAVFLVSLLIYSLNFFSQGQVRIVAKPAESALIMTGRDDGGIYRELIPGKLLNINSASADELALLPGIGDTLAEAILEHRRENGGFTSKEAIMDVYGIGEGKFAAIEDLITIGD